MKGLQVLAAACVLLGSGSPAALGQSASGNTDSASVYDIEAVINESERLKKDNEDIERELSRLTDSVRPEADKLKREMEEIELRLRNDSLGSAERSELTTRLQMRRNRLSALDAQTAEKLDRLHASSIRKFFRELDWAVGQCAQRQGISKMFAFAPFDPSGKMLEAALAGTNLSVFDPNQAAKTRDLTRDVIEQLNQDYRVSLRTLAEEAR